MNEEKNDAPAPVITDEMVSEEFKIGESMEWFLKHSKEIATGFGVDSIAIVPTDTDSKVKDPNAGFKLEVRKAGVVRYVNSFEEIPKVFPPKIQPVMTITGVKELRPNDPCSCGSGKKYKRCCRNS